jgi:hypothetical protein
MASTGWRSRRTRRRVSISSARGQSLENEIARRGIGLRGEVERKGVCPRCGGVFWLKSSPHHEWPDREETWGCRGPAEI